MRSVLSIEHGKTDIKDERLTQIAQIFRVSEETIKTIDPEKVYHQINNDHSTGNMGVIYQENNNLLKQVLDNNQKLMEIMDRRLSELEKKSPG